jgi:hypothetical protein
VSEGDLKCEVETFEPKLDCRKREPIFYRRQPRKQRERARLPEPAFKEGHENLCEAVVAPAKTCKNLQKRESGCGIVRGGNFEQK